MSRRFGYGRRRRHGHDYVYGIEHLEEFPEQYERIEHRFKLADTDWNEFCGYCHTPHTLIEMYRDTPQGQDLSDKGVTVTRRLAQGVNAHAYVMAYLTERPPEVQREIDQLNQRVLELTRQYPIKRFRAQLVTPHRSRVETYTPDEWWSLIVLRHSEHHLQCRVAQRSGEQLANPAWMKWQRHKHSRSGLYVPPQPTLEIP